MNTFLSGAAHGAAIVTVVFLGMGTPRMAAAQSAYTLVELDFFPESINASGQVAGVGVRFGEYRAFRWQNGTFEQIGVPLAPNGVIQTSDINNAGQVAGYAEVAGLGMRGYLWNGNSATILETLGGSYSTAYALNSIGQAAGFAATPTGSSHAVVWNGSTPTDLGTLGGNSSSANDINDLGQIVGQSETGAGQYRAFLYDAGVLIELGTLGGSHSSAYAITNDGLIMGWSLLAGDEVAHPFLWRNGVMTDLGGLPGSTGTTELVNTINAHGQMVGYTQLVLGENDFNAVLRTDAGYVDLNTFVPAGSGLHLRIAQRINDAGQIVGQSTTGGFLLTPVGATLPGDAVGLTPVIELPDGSTTALSIQFASVDQGGETTVTASSTAPPLPSGFQVPTVPLFFDVATTAEFSGVVSICLVWPQGVLQNEANARLLHFENGGWVDITTSVDQASNIVCGQSASLSPFAVAELAYEFLGFRAPLLPGGAASIRQANAGRTIPVKFQLRFGGQLTGGATATIAVYKVLDSVTGSVDTTSLTEASSAADSGTNRFRYDADDEQYVFNLSTKGLGAPATYRIVVTVTGGGVYTADFSLRQ